MLLNDLVDKYKSDKIQFSIIEYDSNDDEWILFLGNTESLLSGLQFTIVKKPDKLVINLHEEVQYTHVLYSLTGTPDLVKDHTNKRIFDSLEVKIDLEELIKKLIFLFEKMEVFMPPILEALTRFKLLTDSINSLNYAIDTIFWTYFLSISVGPFINNDIDLLTLVAKIQFTPESPKSPLEQKMFQSVKRTLYNRLVLQCSDYDGHNFNLLEIQIMRNYKYD